MSNRSLTTTMVLAVVALAIVAARWLEPAGTAPAGEVIDGSALAPTAVRAESATTSPARTAVVSPLPNATLTVVVVDSVSGVPLGNARVRTAEPHARTWIDVAVVGDGRFVRAAADSLFVAVEADGYASVVQRLPSPASGEHAVQLVRGAALALRFVDVTGAPVAGVTARVLPPLRAGPGFGPDWVTTIGTEADRDDLFSANGAPIAERIAANARLAGGRVVATPALASQLGAVVSGADGCAEFGGLPAASGYRWGALSAHVVTVVPPHETAPLRAEDGGVRTSTGRRVRSLSGEFSLAPGERREIEVTVRTPGCVRGRFAASATALRPQVTLYDVTATARGGAVAVEPEAFSTAADDGAFCFRGVRPGNKIVRGYWRTTATDFVFASVSTSLADGAEVDVGTIVPLGGSFRARVDLVDRDGDTLDPLTVLDIADPRAVVFVEGWRSPGDLTDSVLAAVTAPLGKDLLFSGFADGIVRLRSTPAVEWLDPRCVAPRIVDGAQPEVRVPCASTVLLPLTVEMPVRRSLVLHGPPVPLPALQIWLRPLRGGQPQRHRVNPGSRDLTVDLDVLPEPYDVLVFGDTSDGGVVGTARVDFGAAREPVLALGVGAVIGGCCHGPDRAPLPGARLRWTLADWRSEAATTWLFSVDTDRDGRFRLGGLPPGAELLGATSGTDVHTPPPGALSEVLFTLEAPDPGEPR